MIFNHQETCFLHNDMTGLLKRFVSRTIILRSFGAKTECKQSAPVSSVNGLIRTMATNRGALIVFEGCDHSGKTTQCNKLISSMKEKGLSVESMRFPDRTTTIGQMISSYLGNKCEIEDHAVHLLFSANRWEMVPTMKKLLSSGTTLIVDRYAYSGVAFTSAKQGFDMQWCKQPDVGLPKPDAVIYLTLSPEAAEKRGTFGQERYEKTEFQQKVSENFEKLKEDNWKVIDADKSVDDLHKELSDIVYKVIDTSKDKPLEQLWMDGDHKIQNGS